MPDCTGRTKRRQAGAGIGTVLVLVGAGLTGCASARAPAVTGAVRTGPSPPQAAQRALSAPEAARTPEAATTSEMGIEQARALADQGPRPVRLLTNTREFSTPELRAALAEVNASPSVAGHDRAAATYLALGLREQAFDQYAAAVRLDEADAAAHDGLARLWRDWRWPSRALREAHQAVRLAPASSEAWNTLGTILERLGSRREARAAYERSAALNAAAWWAHHNLCALDAAAAPAHADEHCQRADELRALTAFAGPARDTTRGSPP